MTDAELEQIAAGGVTDKQLETLRVYLTAQGSSDYTTFRTKVVLDLLAALREARTIAAAALDDTEQSGYYDGLLRALRQIVGRTP